MKYNAQIEERINSLPKKVQDVLRSGALSESLRALAKKYKIHYDKWEMLENDILLILLSIKPAEELPVAISKTELGAENAQKLYNDLIEYVFKPMRKLLQEALKKSKEEVEIPDAPEIPKQIDPRAPQFHGVKPDPKKGENLDQPFNLGEIPEITDPYREKIEI